MNNNELFVDDLILLCCRYLYDFKISVLLILLLVYINFDFKEHFSINVDKLKKPKNWPLMGFSEKLRYYGTKLLVNIPYILINI